MSPWVRLDDHFDDDPRVATAGPSAAGLLAMLLAYSNRNLCDGFVSANTVRQKAAALVDADAVITLMVKVGLLRKGERDGIPGYFIHADFVQLQPTREQVEAERQARKVRKDRWKARHTEHRSEHEPDSVPNTDGTPFHSRSEHDQNGGGTHRPVPDPDPVPDPVTNLMQGVSRNDAKADGRGPSAKRQHRLRAVGR